MEMGVEVGIGEGQNNLIFNVFLHRNVCREYMTEHFPKFVLTWSLRRLDTLCRSHFDKGDNFCDILIAFLNTTALLKRGLVWCTLWTQSAGL